MNKEDVVYLSNGIILSHKKEWNNAICSNMDGSRDYYIKQSKSAIEKQIPYDITYRWNLKIHTIEQIREHINSGTHGLRNHTYG